MQPNERKVYAHNHYMRNKKDYVARARDWHQRNREKVRRNMAITLLDLKRTILTRYGKNKTPKCCWPGCEEADLDCLTLDHINDNGAQEKKEGKDGVTLFRFLVRCGFPAGYQTLCWNHQWKKEMQRRRNSHDR